MDSVLDEIDMRSRSAGCCMVGALRALGHLTVLVAWLFVFVVGVQHSRFKWLAVCFGLLMLVAYGLAIYCAFCGRQGAEGAEARLERARVAVREFKAERFGQAFPETVVRADVIEDPCSVCLDSLAPGQSCRRLACGHSFHAGCIDEWWMHSPWVEYTCPLCRRHQVDGVLEPGRGRSPVRHGVFEVIV
mmetsp:Transcript_119640/g.381800  ORF Transcript_119640/g.381800 Transcript_119640/m.381800 type:complete len:189 (-) Transcript_119640:58-624(-)